MNPDIVCINLVMRIWSAQKRLTAADIGLPPDQDIPHELGSLGVKRVYDPEKLKDFLSLRRKAERLCQNYGVKFLGGYAVGKDKAPVVVEKLEEIKKEFEEQKNAFLEDYEKACELWFNKVPDKWKQAIKNAIEPKEKVERAISFNYQAYNVQGIDGISATLEEAFDGLPREIARNIREIATDVYEKSFSGKEKVSQKALRPLKALSEKLDSLSFLDSEIAAKATELNATLTQSLPKKGYLEGRDKFTVIGLLSGLMKFGTKEGEEEQALDEEDAERIEKAPPSAWF